MVLPIKKEWIMRYAFAMITFITVMIICLLSETKVNCNDPSVWGTASGVRACAINGGK